MDQDFGGFRVIVLLPRFKPGWVPPGAYEEEGVKRFKSLGAPGRPLPVLMPNGKPICSATVRAGPGFLEVPFFATQETRRRKGYGRALLQVSTKPGLGAYFKGHSYMEALLPLSTAVLHSHLFPLYLGICAYATVSQVALFCTALFHASNTLLAYEDAASVRVSAGCVDENIMWTGHRGGGQGVQAPLPAFVQHGRS